jgi:universal stress protein E
LAKTIFHTIVLCLAEKKEELISEVFIMAGHILIATDLSKRSELALQRGFLLAKAWAAQCTVLYVIDEEQPDEIVREKKASITNYLENQISHLLPAESAKPDILVKAGDIHDMINKTAQEKKSRLIVMGAHRKNIWG